MRYFIDGEFACKHCHQLPPGGMSQVLMKKMDELREKAGAPIIVTSGYRCPEHNAAVGGVWNSQHVAGTAADIYCPKLTVDQLADLAVEVGMDGIGRYYRDGFVHVDCRDGGQSPNYYTWEG